MRPTFEAVVALTDAVCARHLDDDYARCLIARSMSSHGSPPLLKLKLCSAGLGVVSAV
jgi:hypothetical protein